MVVEIGSGFNTPGVIRWPIERIATYLSGSRLIRINPDHSGVPASLAGCAASIDGDAAEFIYQATIAERTLL